MGSNIFGIWGIRNSVRYGLKTKWEDLYFIKFYNQCVNSFQDDLVKRLYNVDAYLQKVNTKLESQKFHFPKSD